MSDILKTLLDICPFHTKEEQRETKSTHRHVKSRAFMQGCVTVKDDAGDCNCAINTSYVKHKTTKGFKRETPFYSSSLRNV